MKFALVILLLCAFQMRSMNHIREHTSPIQFGPQDAYNLVKGLLTGLQFNDVDSLMKCFNNIPDIYNDILTIINLLQNIDIKHLENLIEALAKIFALTEEIIKAVKPCANVKDSERIQEIIERIENANLRQIALNILFHGGQILQDITNLPKDFSSGNFYQFGFDIGDLITQTLLTMDLKFGPDDAYKLVHGMLEGLLFNNVDQLMKCFNDIPDIYNDVLEIVDIVTHLDFQHIDQLILALSKIFDLVSKILEAVDPCADVKDSERIKEIIEKIKNANIYQIAANILLHGGQVLKDITDLPKSFNSGDYHQFGYDIGDLITQILLTSSLKFGPDDAYKLVHGMLEGLLFNNVDQLMKCFNDIPDIYNDVLTIVDIVTHLDFQHIDQLILALSKIFDLVSKILEAVDPCADVKDSERIKEIIEKIKNANLYKIAANILLHGGQVLKDITDLPKSFNSGNYHQFGYDIGDLITQILLTSTLKFGPDDAEKLIHGYLVGLKFPNVDNLMKCLDKVPDIYTDVIEIVEIFEKIDWKNLNLIIDGVTKIFNLSKKILEAIKPCADPQDLAYLQKIIDDIHNANIPQIVLHIVMHGGSIMKDLIDLSAAYQKQDYYKVGYDMGDFVYQVLIA